MTPAQTAVETERARANMLTAPQAEAEMQRGRDTADAQNEQMQRAYQEWIKSDVGEAAAKNIRPIRLHIAFSAGWEARANVQPQHETLAERANHDDKLFAQLCADDAEALKAHEDDAYFTRYGL